MRKYVVILAGLFAPSSVSAGEAPSYAKHVRPIFAKYCLECHNTKSTKGGLDLETHKAMLDGSDNGPVIKTGNANDSLLVQSIEGKARSLMPPKSKTLRPTKAEIATLRAWINAGAKDDSATIKVAIPDVQPKGKRLPSVKALAYSTDGSTVIAARDRVWTYLAAAPDKLVERIKADAGAPISAIAVFGKDREVVAAGEPGKSASIHGLTGKSGKLSAEQPQFHAAHTDLILDLAFSPDGRTLATCSYDTQVKLWDTASGKPLHTLKDHSDSVYGVAFHPHGKMLATCAADRTVKIWDPVTAKLLFTFSESTDWNYAVAWRPNGKHLAAAGVDKSIRVWEVSERGGRIVLAVFAHEGAVIKLIYSKDGTTLYSLGEDRVVKAWDAERMVEKKVYERQPETVLAMALRPDGKQLALGRYDGQVVLLDVATGETRTVTALAAAAPVVQASLQQPPSTKPIAKKITPAEGRRGVPIRVVIEGEHLDGVQELSLPTPGSTGKIISKSPAKLEAEIQFGPQTPAGKHEIVAKNSAGASAPMSFLVDLFATVPVGENNESPGQSQPIKLPATLIGKLDKAGDVDFFRFDATKGQQLGIQILTSAVGSKAEPILQLLDAKGSLLAESASGLLAHAFVEAGTFSLGVRDRELRGGPGMHYRLHIGEIPIVSSVYPLGVQRGTEAAVRVEGVFLTSQTAKIRVPADSVPGSKIALLLTSKHGQPLGNSHVVAGEFQQVLSSSPGSPPGVIPTPGTAEGILRQPQQRDEWRFYAKKGERVIIETHAQRLGSALDSVLEILDARGQPVPRAVLRCQAKTFVTFRDHDNVTAGIRIDAWNDLAVNDYLYVGNELMRITALPAHPDADCNFFASANGPRVAFLDTTPTHHSQNMPMYKVTIHPPGSTFPPNGFPIFTLNYRNDDGGPGYGRDSRIFFDPPADGEYRVRIGDARGQGGNQYGYRLTVRPPRPSFNVRFDPTAPVVWKEGALPVTISVDRLDGYDGPIALRFENVPPGFSVPATGIEAGQVSTAVALYADREAKTPEKPMPLKLIAEAKIDGQKQAKEAVGGTPKVTDTGSIVTFTDESEVTIRPGGEVKVQVHIERRGGFTGRVPLDVKGLPHGVRVLDIGLNGILITERETRRTIVLHAEPWVEPMEHPIVILARQEGKNAEHAAKSVLLRVSAK